MEKSKKKIYSNLGNDDVLNLIPKNAKFILDIGCGDGSNAKHLIKKNYIVDGITISEEEKKIAEKIMRKVVVFNLEDGLPLNGLEVYDVVICSHVLEHICYPEQLLIDIYKVLKNNGILIIALPNIMHYKSRWQLLKGNFNYTNAGVWDFTHFKWYTFKTGKKLLEQYNFKIIVATVTGELPLNSVMKKILSFRLRRLLFSMLIKISNGLFGYQLLFSVIKDKENTI